MSHNEGVRRQVKALNDRKVAFRTEVLGRIQGTIREGREKKAFCWAWVIHIAVAKSFRNIVKTFAHQVFKFKAASLAYLVAYGARKWLNGRLRYYASAALQAELHLRH